MSKIIGDTACPACTEKGRDRTGNHLMLFDDGGAYCNRCGYSEGKGTFTQPKVRFSEEKSDEQIQTEIEETREDSTIQHLEDRAIKSHVCKHYGVRVFISEFDGSTQTARIYPVESLETKELQGFKIKSNEEKSRIWAKGKLKSGALFGSGVIPKKGNKLFITEGEDDALALYQAIYENCDPKWRNSIAVCSLLYGAGGADKELLNNRETLERFKEIVLCFDMDEVGQEGVRKVCKVLDRNRLLEAKYEKKDANDMVKAGLSKELYFNVLSATKPRPEKIISGNEITLEELRKPLKKGIQTIYPLLNGKMRGFRYGEGGGELTVFCAGSGMGKTTAARELMYDFNSRYQLRLGHIFLEEQYRKTGQSLIALDNDVPLAALREDPTIIDEEKFELSYNKLVKNGRTFFMKHFGSLASDHLMDHMWHMSAVDGCNVIMLDHISMVVSGQEGSGQGERKDIDVLMTKLAAFCEDSGTSVIAVVHLKRPPDGKSFNNGKQISLSDLRGSAAIEQLSHNIIAVEGNQHGDDPNRRVLRVLKNREWGNIGEADTLNYNPDTGRLLPARAVIRTEESRF
jgi:twinkle protein